MPANTEYLLAAYGIVIAVVLVYGVGLMLRLKSTASKLKNLQKLNDHEKTES